MALACTDSTDLRVLIVGENALSLSLSAAIAETQTQQAAYNNRVLKVCRMGLDLTDPRSVFVEVAKLRPHVIINCAEVGGIAKPESDPIYAREVNSEGPVHLALAAKAWDAWLIQMSSCYVFQGNRGPYKDTDPTYPLQWYGVSKLLGETVVRQIAPDRSTVIRFGWLFGAGKEGTVRKVVEFGSASAPDHRRGSLAYIPHVAARIAGALLGPLPASVVHLGPLEGSLSLHEALKPFFPRLIANEGDGKGFYQEAVIPNSLGLVPTVGWEIPDPEQGIEAYQFFKITSETIGWQPSPE